MGDTRVLDILRQVEAGELTPEEADRRLGGGADDSPSAPPGGAPKLGKVDRLADRLESIERVHMRHLDRQRLRMERQRVRIERRAAHQRERWARRRLPGVSVDDLIRLRLHGISPDYVEEMREHLGNIPFDKLIELKVHGVTPDLVDELRESGADEVTPDDLLRWKSAVKGSRISDAMSSAMELVGPYVTQLVEASLAEARRHIYEALRTNPPPESWAAVETASPPESAQEDGPEAEE
jgi:hypothetical protein